MRALNSSCYRPARRTNLIGGVHCQSKGPEAVVVGSLGMVEEQLPKDIGAHVVPSSARNGDRLQSEASEKE